MIQDQDSEKKRKYALVSITLACSLSLFDRGLMTMLLQPIKVDLGLSDTQIGFVTGIAFALFYATLGVPIGRWADRSNRVSIVSLAIAVWGLTVMSCVFVTNYVQFVCARIAAAVGEAGVGPPTYALLGDYFPAAHDRVRAMYVYSAAGPIAGLGSFILAGWLNEIYGWRLTFFLVGLPGLALAVVLKFTLPEPRLASKRTSSLVSNVPTLKAVCGVLWYRRSCRHLTIAMTLLFTMSNGLGPWYAAFMMRSHGMGTAELGLWMGLSAGISAILGLVAGNYVVGRWLPTNEKGQMRMAAWAVSSATPCFFGFLMLKNQYLALTALVPATMAFSAFLPPASALLQRLVPNGMRATTMTVMMLLANLIGQGVGPLLVGVLSDLLAPTWGAESLRYSMLLVSLVTLWAAFHFWQVGNSASDDLAAAVDRGSYEATQVATSAGFTSKA